MKKEIVFTLSLIIFSLFCIFILIPAQSPSSNIEGDIPSALVPTLSMIVILFCGIYLLFVLLIKIKSKKMKEFFPEKSILLLPSHNESTVGKIGNSQNFNHALPLSFYRLLLILFSITTYIICVSWIGFYTSTAVYLTFFLFKLNEISLLKCFFYSGLFLALTYFLFGFGLKISLPQGFLL